MTEEAWNTGYARCLGVRLAGDLIGEMDERGEPIVGDTMLLLLNAHYEAIPFTLPALGEGQQWERLLDTADPQGMPRAWPAGSSRSCKAAPWPSCAHKGSQRRRLNASLIVILASGKGGKQTFNIACLTSAQLSF